MDRPKIVKVCIILNIHQKNVKIWIIPPKTKDQEGRKLSSSLQNTGLADSKWLKNWSGKSLKRKTQSDRKSKFKFAQLFLLDV